MGTSDEINGGYFYRRYLILSFIIFVSFVTSVQASPISRISNLNKLKKTYEIKGQGISYIFFGDKITNDNKLHSQAVISLVNLPKKSKVIKAYLFWTGKVLPVSAADTDVGLMLPNEKTHIIHAEDAWSSLYDGLIYSCRADVTKYIKSNGVYILKGINLDPLRNSNGTSTAISGRWKLAIIYKIPALLRISKLSVYSGLDRVLIQDAGPRDAIFYLQKADSYLLSKHLLPGIKNYCIAIKQSPYLAISHILQMTINIVSNFIRASIIFIKPMLVVIVSIMTVFFFIYAILINTIYLLLTIIAGRETNKYLVQNKNATYHDFIAKNKIIPISVFIAAYNEEDSIVRTIDALLRSKYPQYEIIVINDGSKDMTLDVMVKKYGLFETKETIKGDIQTHKINRIFRSGVVKNLVVIDKENSGKADSLNAGINLSTMPLFCTIDADTILEEDSLFQLALPILKNPDEVVATTGMVRFHNGCLIKDGILVKKDLPRTFLGRIQVLEYIRAYGIGRIGWNIFNAHVIVSGTFSLYKKALVKELGGYHRYSIGEDVELNMRIHRFMLINNQKYKIIYAPSAQCFTQAPTDLKSLARQRNRWHQGLLTSLRLNMFMLFNPRYGYLGLLAVPFYALFEFPAPIIESIGYVLIPIFIIFNMLSIKYMLILLGIVIFYGIALSIVAVIVDIKYFKFYSNKIYRRIFLCSLFECAGFHQLTVYWRLKGMFDYLKKVHIQKMGWHSPGRLKTA